MHKVTIITDFVTLTGKIVTISIYGQTLTVIKLEQMLTRLNSRFLISIDVKLTCPNSFFLLIECVITKMCQ